MRRKRREVCNFSCLVTKRKRGER